MQHQDSKVWEAIRLPGESKTLYHCVCHKSSKGTGPKTDIKINEAKGSYIVMVSAKVAGAELFRENWTFEMVNDFLSKLGFPSLPACPQIGL